MLIYIENMLIILCVSMTFSLLLSKQPIQALLSLIFIFGIVALIFFFVGVEFVSLLIFVVYIGAIAVLFLFVIMMLNVKIVELRTFYLRYLPIGFFMIFFFLLELYYYVYMEVYNFDYNIYIINWFVNIDFSGNVYLLACVIYSNYFYVFVLLALLLFVAMIGSIVLLVGWVDNARIYKNLYYYESFKRNRVKNIYLKIQSRIKMYD